jgi:hypothetical protein
MHPFLPVLSVIFLLTADAAMLFLRLNATHPEIAPHAGSIYTVVFMCLLIGSSLAFWLRRFGVLYPGWVAILSLLGVALIGFSRF